MEEMPDTIFGSPRSDTSSMRSDSLLPRTMPNRNSPISVNNRLIGEVRLQLDQAKTNGDKKRFAELVKRHKSLLAQRRELLLQQDPVPGRYTNQSDLYDRVAEYRNIRLPMGNNYKDFAKMFRRANPKATPLNVNVAWRRYKRENGLPETVTSCQRLPVEMCDQNPKCEYSIGMKKQGCRKAPKKSPKSSAKKSPRRMSSKKKSRSRRKPCAGAKKSQCSKRTNCTWRKSKGCRRSARRRSRSPARRRKSPTRKSRSPARRRRCPRGVKKTSPRKGSCRRKPGRKSRKRRSR